MKAEILKLKIEMVNGGPGCEGARYGGNGAIGEVSLEVEEIGVQIGAALVE